MSNRTNATEILERPDELSSRPDDDIASPAERLRRWMSTPIARSSFWTIFCYGATQAQRLVGNVMLAWLLFPQAFGIMALVNVSVQGLQMFSDIGIGPSIIQHRRGTDPLFLNTAWTIQVVRGLVLAACSALLAWPLAAFYDQPQLGPLICAAGLTAAISGFNSTYLFTVRRSLNLRTITLLEIGAQAAGILVSCAWALASRSVWAFMSGAIVSSFVRMGFSHVLNRTSGNRFAWDREAYRELLSFGKWIFVSTIITFFSMQGDRIVLSKLIPLEVLGVYTVALAVALLPNVLLSTLTFSVLYPLLCQAGRIGQQRLEAQLLRARALLLSFGLVAVFAVGAGAEIFFHVLYDVRYHDAIWMTQLMCVSVWLMVLNTTLETSLLSLGDSRSAAFCGLIKFIACTLASLAGFQLIGPAGFILGVGVGTAAGQFALLIILARHGIRVVRQDLSYTALILAAGAAAVLSRRVLPHGELLVGVAVVGVVLLHLAHTRRNRPLIAGEG